MSLRSSTKWRQSDYNLIFWPSLACFICISLALWNFQEFYNVRTDSNASESEEQILVRTINLIVRRLMRSERREGDEFQSILEHTSTIPLDDLGHELDKETRIPIVSLNANYSPIDDTSK